MSDPGVGFAYPPQEVSWLKRDVLLFANSIGCKSDELHFLYELHPNFSAFPTYPLVLPFKGNASEVVDFYSTQKAVKIPGVPEFDYRRLVDGQRKIEFLKKLPTTSAGKTFQARTKVIGVYDKGRPGTVLETQTDLVDTAAGDVYTRITSSSFFVAQGNWHGPKGPATQNFPPPKGKAADAVMEHQTTTEAALLYRLNGDYNPLHATPEPGQKMGFKGAITHGLYQWNNTCHAILRKFGGGDPANIKEYQARFASPVMPGDKLVTSVWRTGEKSGEWEEVRFVTQVEAGKVCLSNGRALIRHAPDDMASQCSIRDENTPKMAQSPYIGQRVSYNGALCTVRYIGEVAGTTGSWLGVEWDDANRGKHDGSLKGVRYFACHSRSLTSASFVRPTRPADRPQSFIAALNEKYVSETPQAENGAPIVISGKVAEEMGFDKIRRVLARLKELKIVILDGLRVASATEDGEGRVAETCPSIVHLDLSRSLLERLGPVVDVCSELKALTRLSLNGNRFQGITSGESMLGTEAAFRGVIELALGETLLSWEELSRIATLCTSLTTLAVGTNQLTTLPTVGYRNLTSTLTSINLEYNDFHAMSDLASLTALKALRNLHLKGNSITGMAAPGTTAPIFPPSLQYLDVSYNDIQEWSFVDALSAHFPGLAGLRLAHNPVHDKHGGETKAPSSEESHMFTIGRVASLTSVNFTQIKPADRTNAEMFYLSRIAKQLATVPESAEHTILALNPRYAKLCKIYGEPDVIRRNEVNPSFLEARLVSVSFRHEGKGQQKTSRIPKSFDIYAVKGIAGKLFGLSPLRLRLIWETGEWDPVAGYDERDGESSDEGDSVLVEAAGQGGGDDHPEGEDKYAKDKSGRWVKREVELTDGPKQLGYCVDGLDVTVRIEMA
ncbi:Tubulin-specific chaperone E [Tolypocladium ophioglossoides CBS 100239]|uniref:Tubulin-specific chaperone E n=1 Tax=Tolypocladium ophioglossoides (strain CBS 100239) TaxID=1163406 RepID=A0A0L0NMI3_TOLOC|nr:Tubulin-specific chaperone E [Tolypocladium ophioglossoides CBS 100239]